MNQRRLLNVIAFYLRRLLRYRYDFLWLKNLDSIPINRPIFLLGVQGGGITLLARMLRRHPYLVSVSGNYHFWTGPDEMQNVLGRYLPPELTGLHSKAPHHEEYPERGSLYAINDLLPLYRQTSQAFTETIKEKFLQAIRLPLAAHAVKMETARFIDKSQTFTVRLSLVNMLLQDLKPYFIIITRNPYAHCFRSVKRVGSFQRLNMPIQKRLELAAQHWANSFNCAVDDARDIDNLLIVQFESLLSSPYVVLSQICHFLDLDFRPNLLPSPLDKFPLGATRSSKGDRKWYPLRPDVNRTYLAGLEPWMIDIMQPYVGELADKWHYQPKVVN